MGCVYSHTKERRESKVEDTILNTTSSSHPVISNRGENYDRPVMVNGPSLSQRYINASSSRNRSFEVSTLDHVSKDGNTGILQIFDREMVLRLSTEPSKSIQFQFRALRKYGKKGDVFSFEMGRRCVTGPGVFYLKCQNSDELFAEFSAAIDKATANSSSISAINQVHTNTNSLPGHGHSSMQSTLQNGQIREYQNMALSPSEAPSDNSIMVSVLPNANRPQSSLANASSERQTYTNLAHYLNLANNSKSQPNYYTSYPIWNSGSKASLDENSPPPQIRISHDFFSFSVQDTNMPLTERDIPSNSLRHEYVNSNMFFDNAYKAGQNDPAVQSRRRSCENEHIYENHELPALSTAKKMEEIKRKMTSSDDLGTFCMVNIDADTRKERPYFNNGLKNPAFPRSARTTPEPPSQSYIQLDLKIDKHTETNSEASERNPENVAKKQNEKLTKEAVSSTNGLVERKSSPCDVAIASTSIVLTSSNDVPTMPGANENGPNKPNTTVPYAQIDFDKTTALSNSTAYHRKL